MDEKCEFASPQWIDLALKIAKKLVLEAGDDGKGVKFSICETYTDAPFHLAQKDGKISWYFRINGRNIETGAEERDEVDYKIIIDYEINKKISKLVYGEPGEAEEIDKLAREAYKAGKFKIIGNRDNAPAYLRPMHNMLAKRTL
jgi:hypothetical protein